ncbi:MAG: chromosomal replication initiator protein DnaA [Ignavibacteriales bacterium]|nr:chromosomal replication initiator protein DnaA [Ignavibacteriales bacterium]
MERLRKKVSPRDFSSWIEQIIPLEINDKVAVLQVHSQFFSDWVEAHFGLLLSATLSDLLKSEVIIEYRIKKEDMQESPSAADPLLRPQPNSLFGTTSIQQPREFIHPTPQYAADHFLPPVPNTILPKFTFDNFIKGDSNKFAYAAATNVANNPAGSSFNPLVIYGGVGLGKTHLIQAIGNYVLTHKKAHRVLYVSSEEFLRNFVESIQKDKMSEFTNFYRTLDLLIVDDIQFLTGEKTQDYFFHTFNALYQLGKQIVLTSDRTPKELKGIDERLISRFQMGLLADVQPPDLETRIAILYKKSESLGVSLPQDVAELLAQNITSNIRQLEGCLISLMAKSSLENQKISLDSASDVLRTIVGGIKSVITIQDIQKVVSSFYNIPEDLLHAKTRKQEIVLARQVAMYLAKELTNSTFQTIGFHFGGRDHTTVIHAYQTIEDYIKKDEQARSIIHQIKTRLQFSEKR